MSFDILELKTPQQISNNPLGCDLNSFLKWWDNPTTKHVVTSSTDVNAIRVMTIHKSKGLEFKCVHIPIGSWALAKDSRFGWYQSPHIEGIDPMLIPPIFALKNEKKLLDTPFESKYQSILNEALLDTINVTYVAFTRAINELCVTCISPTRNGENNIDAAVYNSFNTANSEFCNNLTSQYPNIDQELFIPLNNYDSEETLIIGNPTTPQKEFNVKEISPSEKVEIKEASPYITEDRDDIWNLTRLEDYTPIDEARERGIFLHNVLSNVNRIEDLPISINRWGYKARLDKESIDNAFEFLNKAISSPKVIQWFDGFKRALTERSIIVKETNSTFRPDRVVWTANNTVDVIDYKFGEEHKAQYEKQIKNYMYLLSEMGNENVRGFIWYLDKDKIIEVK